jgi:hypothetical protein
MLVRKKVPKHQVPAFEKMLGFKTTGEISIQTHDKKTQAAIDTLLEELYLGSSSTSPSS